MTTAGKTSKMREIRDCKGRLTCLADENTDEIETRYKGAIARVAIDKETDERKIKMNDM